jgi:hypothetical protein
MLTVLGLYLPKMSACSSTDGGGFKKIKLLAVIRF